MASRRIWSDWLAWLLLLSHVEVSMNLRIFFQISSKHGLWCYKADASASIANIRECKYVNACRPLAIYSAALTIGGFTRACTLTRPRALLLSNFAHNLLHNGIARSLSLSQSEKEESLGSERQSEKERAREKEFRERGPYIQLNKDIIAASKAGHFDHLCALVQGNWQNFNAVNAATAYKELLLMRTGPGPLGGASAVANTSCSSYDILESAIVEQHLSAFSARDCANVLYAMAKTTRRVPRPHVMHALQRRSAQTAAALSAQGLANTLWAYSTMQKKQVDAGFFTLSGCGEDLVGSLEVRGEAIAGTLNPQEATNILWAFATLKRRPTDRLLQALERNTEAMASRYNSQDVANTLWAYASIRTKPGERLAQALERRLEVKACDFTPQEVANTLWAFTMLGVIPGESAVRALERRAREIAVLFNSQEVANMLWAASFLSIHIPDAARRLALTLDGTVSLVNFDSVQACLQVRQFFMACDLEEPLLRCARLPPGLTALRERMQEQSAARLQQARVALEAHHRQEYVARAAQDQRLLQLDNTAAYASDDVATATALSYRGTYRVRGSQPVLTDTFDGPFPPQTAADSAGKLGVVGSGQPKDWQVAMAIDPNCQETLADMAAGSLGAMIGGSADCTPNAQKSPVFWPYGAPGENWQAKKV